MHSHCVKCYGVDGRVSIGCVGGFLVGRCGDIFSVCVGWLLGGCGCVLFGKEPIQSKLVYIVWRVILGFCVALCMGQGMPY